MTLIFKLEPGPGSDAKLTRKAQRRALHDALHNYVSGMKGVSWYDDAGTLLLGDDAPINAAIEVTPLEFKDDEELRVAPADAWGTIDETLEIDQESIACTPDLREEIGRAYAAMRRI